MLEQQRLQLRGRDLVALDLDEFLLAVDDEEVPALGDVRDVAGLEPAVGGKGFAGGFFVLPVAGGGLVSQGEEVGGEDVTLS